MIDKKTLMSMAEDIQKMRSIAEHLKEKGKQVQAIDRNIVKILSSIRLLEMNVSDVVKIV